MPSLLYCSPIWSPYLGYHMKSLEAVQRKFMRFLSFKTDAPMSKCDHDYHLISEKLNLPTVYSLHRYNDMLLVWKILNGVMDIEDHGDIFKKRVIKYNLRSSKTYFEVSVKSNLLSNFTTYRLIRQWNQLDERFADIATIDAAKNSLKLLLFAYYGNC